MQSVLYTMLGIYILSIIYCLYMLYRNEKVNKFRHGIIEILSDGAKKRIKEGKSWEPLYNYLDKYSHEYMLFSFKPLKLDAWYTKDELKIMRGE